MYTLCQNFSKLFPNVEKADYFPTNDSIRIYGTAITLNDMPPYTADIVPNTVFKQSNAHFWDQYDSYLVILHHGKRCRTGEFSTDEELKELIHRLFEYKDIDAYLYGNTNIDEYHVRAEEFFFTTLDEFKKSNEVEIVSIEYQMRTMFVMFPGHKNMWRIRIATKHEVLPSPDCKYVLTPYICALERANPAYGYFGTCYAYITADSTAEFIDKVLHPQKVEPIDQSEILDAINGAEKNPES